jgi:hypothetical protein
LVKLSVGDNMSDFKATRDDLIRSYKEALIRYASTSYADRVRKRNGGPPSIGQNPSFPKLP